MPRGMHAVIRQYAVMDGDEPELCDGKISFPSPGNADAAGIEMQALGCGPQRCYRCPHRNHWHLSKESSYNQSDMRIASLLRILLSATDCKIARADVKAAIDWGELSNKSRTSRFRKNLRALEGAGAIRCSGEGSIFILDRGFIRRKLFLLDLGYPVGDLGALTDQALRDQRSRRRSL